MSITLKEYLTTNLKYDFKSKDFTTEQLLNAKDLIARINIVRKAYNKPMTVSSGMRTHEINDRIGGAKRSNHLLGRAIDIYDPYKNLAKWCLANKDILIEAGLWIECLDVTTNWVHFQSVPPRSGARMFHIRKCIGKKHQYNKWLTKSFK